MERMDNEDPRDLIEAMADHLAGVRTLVGLEASMRLLKGILDTGPSEHPRPRAIQMLYLALESAIEEVTVHRLTAGAAIKAADAATAIQ